MSKGSAVVAGVGEGLGSAVARRFAAAGYNAVMWARSEDKVKDTPSRSGRKAGRPRDEG
jgi:NADP-dependent 3-hydroxy acid dehydrogenase YdfG